jgi:hypothetical protein
MMILMFPELFQRFSLIPTAGYQITENRNGLNMYGQIKEQIMKLLRKNNTIVCYILYYDSFSTYKISVIFFVISCLKVVSR